MNKGYMLGWTSVKPSGPSKLVQIQSSYSHSKQQNQISIQIHIFNKSTGIILSLQIIWLALVLGRLINIINVIPAMKSFWSIIKIKDW